MFKTILVPLDGSPLAECVLPHVLPLATVMGARIHFLHVLERPRDTGALQPIDPLRWAFKRNEAEAYLKGIWTRFKRAGMQVEYSLQEGTPSEVILNHARLADADLIALSTHGSSGLSGWNICSVVQKIVLRANRSILVVRAYRQHEQDAETVHYRRIFVGLDASPRAELVLPVAVSLAGHFQADLILGTVVEKPDLTGRLPLSDEDWRLLESFAERNREFAAHYLEQVKAQLATSGICVTTRLVCSPHVMSALHAMVQDEASDLVMLAAHGRSAEGRWPYGSVTTSFITHGNTSLFIMQDLQERDIQPTLAEQEILQFQGH